MENSSLPSDILNNVTTYLSEEDDIKLNIIYVRDLALKVIYNIIGTVGVLDNLFVIIIFIFFVKIADKVFFNIITTISVLEHTCYSALYMYAIARPSVCSSVRLPVSLSVTRVNQSKTVEVRICNFYRRVAHDSSFCVVNFTVKFQRKHRERGRRMREVLENTQFSANKSPYLRNSAR